MLTENKIYIDRFSNVYNGWVLPLSAFVGLTLPFFIPTFISIWIKPIAVLAAALFVKKYCNGKIFISGSSALLALMMLIYIFSVLRAVNISDGIDAIGNLLCMLYAYSYISIEHSRECVKRLIYACFAAGLIFAIIAAISNPFFGTTALTRTSLYMFSIRMNSNQISYVVAIGVSVLPLLVVDKERLVKRWKFYTFSFLIMIYVVLLTMSRGAFVAVVATSCLLFYKILKTYSRKSIVFLCVGLILILTFILVLLKYMPQEQINRLFSIDSYSNTNGRADMYLLAIEEVKNPIFGGGASLWTGSGKIHNAFINMYVETGIAGAGIMILLFSLEILKIRRLEILCISIPMLLQGMVESGDSYTMWVPFILVCLLNREYYIYKDLSYADGVLSRRLVIKRNEAL